MGYCGVGLSALTFKKNRKYILDIELSMLEGQDAYWLKGADKGVIALVNIGKSSKKILVSDEFDLPLKK